MSAHFSLSYKNLPPSKEPRSAVISRPSGFSARSLSGQNSGANNSGYVPSSGRIRSKDSVTVDMFHCMLLQVERPIYQSSHPPHLVAPVRGLHLITFFTFDWKIRLFSYQQDDRVEKSIIQQTRYIYLLFSLFAQCSRVPCRWGNSYHLALTSVSTDNLLFSFHSFISFSYSSSAFQLLSVTLPFSQTLSK